MPDSCERAADEQDAVERRLAVRVDNREDEESKEAARHGGEAGLESDAPAAAGTSMVVGQVPLAPGTCSHAAGVAKTIAHGRGRRRAGGWACYTASALRAPRER